ncbi:unnamed protein product [Closterium sp. NIES-54]
MSVRRMSRDTGISRKSLSEWKSRKGELEGAHGARKRLHGRGRASWYRDMEIEVYSRVLAHRKRCLAMSVGRLKKWSHDVMKILHPEVKWAGSQRWTERFRWRWNLTTRAKTIVGQKLSSDVVVAVHPNGWMDADSVLAWLDGTVNPYVNPRFGVHGRKVMLVLDSYRGHLTDAVKAKSGELNIVPAVIPAGCTSKIQPLDDAVNRSFKAAVRQLHQEWFESEGVDCLTERVFPCVAGNIRKPPPELTLKWISKAWKAVPKELIQRSFLTSGISNALDGSQDNLCMQHRRDAVKGEV